MLGFESVLLNCLEKCLYIWSVDSLHKSHSYWIRVYLALSTDGSMVTALKAEINRLQERLIAVETENLYLNKKVTQQRWDMDHRLAEIEMQICKDVGSSADSSCDDNERNKESII